MQKVSVKVGGQVYNVACGEGQEKHLILLSQEVDRRLRLLAEQMGGHPPESMGLLLVSLMMADELIENNEQISNLTARVENIAQALEIQ